MPDGSAEGLAEHLKVAGELPALLPAVDEVARAIVAAYRDAKRIATFGNGGSAAASMHFAEELVARFKRERRPLPAQSLAADPTTLTCIANDSSFDVVFERQVRGFVRAGGIAIGFSTSG